MDGSSSNLWGWKTPDSTTIVAARLGYVDPTSNLSFIAATEGGVIMWYSGDGVFRVSACSWGWV